MAKRQKLIKVIRSKQKQDQYDPHVMMSRVDLDVPNSIEELFKSVKEGKTEIIGKIICHGKNKERQVVDVDSRGFVKLIESQNENLKGKSIREAFDAFGYDAETPSVAVAGSPDFVPILGGPFYKQLYQTDFLKQANLAFYASNHDPIARDLINIVRDFTLGRGFRVDSKNKAAVALWRAFEKVNKLQTVMDRVARELQINGEIMFRKLPNRESKFYYRPRPDEVVPKGMIPRVVLTDSTNIWEIVTRPEDVNDPLYYVWLAPTQWQTYTSLGGHSTPSSKFIFMSIPAEEMMHYKVNAFSNEKRGRSDLFPILGYLKRLRDSVEYAVIAAQKQSAWSIDTTIEGSQADLDAYGAEQEAMGSIPTAGSEFIHTKAVTRTFLAPTAGQSKGQGNSFDWCLSMICAGYGVPVSYLGTHLSGGQTRASALVSTEPAAKKFESRQNVYREILQDLWDYCMDYFGLGHVECEITFPEIAVEDRNAKIRDILSAMGSSLISKRRAANMVAKELQISEFEYDTEQEEISKDGPVNVDLAALTTPPSSAPITNKPSSEEKAPMKDWAQLDDEDLNDDEG